MTKRRRDPRPRRGEAGFSLLEVVIAIGILSFGLLTLALMQVHSLTQGAAGRHTGDASAVARSYIEQVQRVPWTVLTTAADNGWRNPDWAAAPATVNVNVSNGAGVTTIEETYNVQWRVTSVGGNACLRDVEVRVQWNEEKMSLAKQNLLATRRYNWGGATC